jgi:hypothetical protein
VSSDEQSVKQGRPWTVESVFPSFDQADESRCALLQQGVPEVKVKRYQDEFGRVTFAVKARRQPTQSADKSKSKSKLSSRDKKQ